jgi:hypothetical protein
MQLISYTFMMPLSPRGAQYGELYLEGVFPGLWLALRLDAGPDNFGYIKGVYCPVAF